MNLPYNLEKILPQLRRFLDDTIQIQAYSTSEKAQVMEHLLWLLRVSDRDLKQTIDFKQSLSQLKLKSQEPLAFSIGFDDANQHNRLGSAKRPFELQPLLLKYLLLQGNRSMQVLDLIDQFILEIYNDLNVEDFKRTHTGVIRCYTNTRFAAKTLREYGFLRFTKNEAYKSWRLTFPGLLAAGYFYLNEDKTQTHPVGTWHSMHPELRNIIRYFSDMTNCLKTLKKLTGEEGESFSSYAPMLRSFAERFSAFHKKLSDADNPLEIKMIARDWTNYLDQKNDLYKFAEDFCMSAQIKRFEGQP